VRCLGPSMLQVLPALLQCCTDASMGHRRMPTAHRTTLQAAVTRHIDWGVCRCRGTAAVTTSSTGGFMRVLVIITWESGAGSSSRMLSDHSNGFAPNCTCCTTHDRWHKQTQRSNCRTQAQTGDNSQSLAGGSAVCALCWQYPAPQQ
jgi:hypothetical protein